MGIVFDKSAGASFNIGSLVFYNSVVFKSEELKKVFEGSSFGLSFPGGGITFGQINYNSIEELTSSTKFSIQGTLIAMSVEFLQGTTVTGLFVGGGVSTVVGVSGGSGSWSDI
ncbi:virulence associated protein VapA [Ceratobasidium sp. AG-Ba]|nr:virulence associated protein VapA [Ceratobasidium sp. AG-Ba]QRW11294.1 virulence associated protein VapA [Ceratobasidium sp. AG-Ba]